MRKFILLIFLCYSFFFFLGSTLAPILAYLKYYELSAVLTSTYMFSCHQQPDRSFWLLGYPLALCCRCYGFYLGVIITSVLAFFNKLKINLNIFLLIFVLCIIDIIINYVTGPRMNTGNITRFIMGLLMGLLFITGLDYVLNFKKEKEE